MPTITDIADRAIRRQRFTYAATVVGIVLVASFSNTERTLFDGAGAAAFAATPGRPASDAQPAAAPGSAIIPTFSFRRVGLDRLPVAGVRGPRLLPQAGFTTPAESPAVMPGDSAAPLPGGDTLAAVAPRARDGGAGGFIGGGGGGGFSPEAAPGGGVITPAGTPVTTLPVTPDPTNPVPIVPPVATPSPAPTTVTPTPTPTTPTPTPTPTTPSPTPTTSSTPSPVPTGTIEPTPTPSTTTTPAPVPTGTASPTPTPTPTSTSVIAPPVPTPTPSPVPAVPEPATWAMMLIGFMAIGASVRARRLPVSAAPA